MVVELRVEMERDDGDSAQIEPVPIEVRMGVEERTG